MNNLSHHKIEIKFYKTAAVVIPSHGKITGSSSGGSSRGCIVLCSSKSLKRCTNTFKNASHLFTTEITLTYPDDYPCDGTVSKKHLDRILKGLKRWGVIDWAWVLEFQERGAPHYHLLIGGWVDKDKLARAWFRIVGSGDEKHLQAGTRVSAIRSQAGAAVYAAGYAAKSKSIQKLVPAGYEHVGRFWGCSKSVSIEAAKCEVVEMVFETDKELSAVYSSLAKIREEEIKPWLEKQKAEGKKVHDWVDYGGGFSSWKVEEIKKVLIDLGVYDGKEAGGNGSEKEKEAGAEVVRVVCEE